MDSFFGGVRRQLCDAVDRSIRKSLILYLTERGLRDQSVSRFGRSGKQRDLGSNPLRLSFRFKNCGLWTLSCDFVPDNYEVTFW